MRKNVLVVLMAVASLLALVGCGGGEGGESVTWNGATTPAVMDTGDMVGWAIDMYNVEIPEPELVTPDVGEPTSLLAFVRGLPSQPSRMKSYLKAAVGSRPLVAPQAYSVVATLVIQGSISGTLNYTAKEDEGAGAIYIEMVASDFADTVTQGGYLWEADGTAIIELKETLDESSMEMIFRDYRQYYEGYGEELVFDGSASVTNEYGEDSETFRMNLDFAVLLLGKDGSVYDGIWINDWKFTEVDDYYEETTTTTGSGRLYTWGEGYVDFLISPAMVQGYYDDNPSSGAITFSAAGGTWAKLEFLTWETFRVTACTDGDGTAEFDSGETYWVY